MKIPNRFRAHINSAFALLLFFLLASVRGDTIVLRSGQQISGRVLKEITTASAGKQLVVKLDSGEVSVIPSGDVLRVDSALGGLPELSALSATLADNIAKSGKKSVAVVDFLDLKGQVTDGGRLFADEVTVNLVAAEKGFKVIERSRLKTILEELKLGSTGIIDEKTVQKLGQITGADAIIAGTVTRLGDSIRTSIKVLAVDTGQVIAAGSTTITKTRDNARIWDLFNEIAESPQPAGSSVGSQNLMLATAPGTSYIGAMRMKKGEGVERIRLVFTEQKDFLVRAEASNPDDRNGKRALTGELRLTPEPEEDGSAGYSIVMSVLGKVSNASELSGLYAYYASGMKLRLTDKGLEGEVTMGGNWREQERTIRLLREGSRR